MQLAADVDSSGKVTSFVQLSGEALKFHKPGKILQWLFCKNNCYVMQLFFDM